MYAEHLGLAADGRESGNEVCDYIVYSTRTLTENATWIG
jgi:hypothetical protein